MHKLYCYVDETGQDTLGKIFLVSIVVSDQKEKDFLEGKLSDIEQRTGKKLAKWNSAPHRLRIDYLNEVFTLKKLKNNICYGIFKETKEYVALTTYTIAQSIHQKVTKNYQATIIIDGLHKKDREKVSRGLKSLHIRYRKIRGAKDESSSLLRLADSIAGFLRDYIEDKKYAQEIFRRFKLSNFIEEIKK